MGMEAALPAWAQKGAAKAFAELNASEDSLSEGIGQGYPVIGYKGKVWSWRYRGQRQNFIRPDDGTPAAYIDVIILGQAKTKSKSYYKAFDPTQQEGDRPICSSLDGVTPDPDVMQKQAEACALCPRNIWKTDANGRKGRECTDYKRLAVLVLPTMTAPLNGGQGVLEPAFLRVPPASLNALAIMGDTMAAQGFHYSSYVTRIKFDPQEAHPKMIFEALQPLSDEEAPVILQMRKDMQVERIIHGGFVTGQGQPALPPPQTAGLITVATKPAVSPPPSTAGLVQTSQPPSSLSGLASAPPAGQGGPAPGILAGLSGTPAAPPSGPGNGLGTPSGIVTPASTQPASQTQAPMRAPSTTQGDAGAAEATDDDLDAMIAKMLPTS